MEDKNKQSEVNEGQVQDFWTRFPMVYTNPETHSPERVFEDMERKLRDAYWYAQAADEPLLARYIDYASIKGRSTLEIGFGTGWLLNEMVRAGADVHGIDLSKTHFGLCSERFRDKNVTLQVASAEKIPYPDETFDFVAAWGVIHHASDDARCYAEVHRVLKKGGRAFLMVYRRGGVRYNYQFLFKRGVLRGGLIRHGFSVEAFIRSVTDKYTSDSPGAPISRHYTDPELRGLLSAFSRVDLQIAGSRSELSEIPFRYVPLSDWVLSDDRRAELLRRLGAFWIVDAVK